MQFFSRRTRRARSKVSTRLASRSGAKRRQSFSRKLTCEPLEPRTMLAAAGLVDVGTQPVGELTGKIVYTHGGHGYTADNLVNGAWTFQRPLLLNMIEDLGNQDQMTFFSEYLFRAGATVVPLRPVGHQSNEIVLDNDDTEVTFSGAWSDSTATIYFGDPGDVPYRFASTSATETAFARYQPNVTEEGFYPVYAWTRSGSDRATDQLYRVNHSGGITEVTVNHRRVGNGLVYLGTYHFEAGTDGYVDISNRSNDVGSVVIADMIRFGNGVGDIDRGGGVSGRDRTDEAGLYWVKWHVDHSQGIPDSEYRTSSSDRSATVSLSPRYAEYMNREADGSLSDRVFVSFHSNAGGGRGILGLYNGNNDPNTATPNQFFLADTLGRETNDDLVDQNGQFEHNWFDRGAVVTLDRSDIEFGEINNLRINNEFDATIVETGFHDSSLDAELLRDPNVRDALARATYQGLIRYFNVVDAGATQLDFAPGKVAEVRAETAGGGSVTVSWAPPVANTYNGDAATGYMVYGSTNGYGFDGGTFVAGGGSTSHTFVGLDVNEEAYYFKVVAVNAGGESPDSEVVAAIPNAGAKDILIVNGFDRLGRTQNPVQSGAERVRPDESNSFDYVSQVATAIEEITTGLVVDTASNESVIAGDVNLSDYTAVVWILGEESTTDDTFNATEQAQVTAYLAAGGKLFLSGSEIGWDLDSQNNGRTFYENTLHSNYVSDDAATYDVDGNVGSIFDGLSFSFDDGSQFYDVNFPDVIAPLGGSTAAMTYSTGGTAAIQFDGGAGQPQIVMLGFPFETITDPIVRSTVMSRVLEYFDFSVDPLPPMVTEFILDNDAGASVYTETGSWSTVNNGMAYDGLTYRFTPAGGSAATAQWQFNATFAGQGEVSVFYSAGSNRTDSTVYEIETGSGTEFANINQKINDLQWVTLGTFDFTLGTHTILIDAQASSGGSVSVADAVRVTLSSAPDPTADFNEDTKVNGFDFLAWQLGLGTTSGASLADGDADFDGDVDDDDLTVWDTQFGTTTIAAASSSSQVSALAAAVSEPAQASVVSNPPSEDSLVALAQRLALHHDSQRTGWLPEFESRFADRIDQVRDHVFDAAQRVSESIETSPFRSHYAEIDSVASSIQIGWKQLDQAFDELTETGLWDFSPNDS